MAASSSKMKSKWILFACLFTLVKGQGSSFYDKGSVSLDATVHKKARVDLPQGKHFAFYGGQYSSIWLTTDGFLSFDERAEYSNTDFSTGDVRPSSDYPIIAPFFHSGEALDSHSGAGTIYYRTLDPSQDSAELNMFGVNISNAVVGIKNFQPTGGIIVTWDNVADAIEISNGCNPCKRSSFQAAILTDERAFTFAIFNYGQMDIDIRRYYQSGFNAGYGGGWTTAVPQSELNRAQSLKGSDVQGRYYFRVCADRIIRGGCRDRNLQTDGVPLEMWPSFGGMYGGQTIEMSGSCINPDESISCSFGNSQVVSDGIYINSMKTKCSVPRLLERGRVTVSLRHGNGRVYSGIITIVSPGRMKDPLHSIDTPGSGWNTTDTATLSMTWDSSLLSEQRNARVTIKLIGYRERGSKAEWVELAVLGSGPNAMNNGRYTFNTRDHRCSGDLCDVETGVVEVRLDDPTSATSHLFLVSRELPLGWFVNNDMIQRYGNHWPHDKCMLWYNNDRQDMAWLQSLPYCPCNLGQALVDIGRFQTDPGCDMFRGSKCTYHIGAIHCVRAVKPTPLGSGNQCCYGPDGALRYAADTFQGSTPDRSHAWGAFPYGRTDLVPSMSHWVKDVVTFYYCCLWTNYADCDYYMDQRATRDCTGYSPPRAAAIYGQGHVRTLGNRYYRVYGAGDFILLETMSNDVSIQGRFSRQYQDTSSKQQTSTTLNSSVFLSSIGVSSGKEIVEIKLDRNSPRRMLNVLVNNTFQFFDSEPLYMQQFSEMTIVNSPNTAGNINSNFTVILKNGMGVQVVAANGMLNVLVMVPYTMKGQVHGLLGKWNDNGTDDFTSRSTNQIVTSTDNPTFYNQFTYSWSVNDSTDSILPHYVSPKTPSDLTNNVPFPMTPSLMHSVCFTQKDCQFDYQHLNKRAQATQTRMSAEWFAEVQSLVTPVRSCGLLNVPRSTKSNFNYSLGSMVTVTGCRTGQLQGDSAYTCEATSNITQTWSPSVSAVCANIPLDEADIGMIVGIVVAIVVVLAVAVFIAIILRRRSRKDKRGNFSEDRNNPVSSGEYDAHYSKVNRREEVDVPRKKDRKSKDLDM
ncbi:sushi domain-containing protein 2-like isoform X2 [Pecten maximus]|uniref:sushi domain-containing protein 2-like isoform X2 n=2 Tax=Pecten maximus TaxID=6579 RepID=UPI0014591909|nr:sushi domain-containing protein 2-like isoform X2 [Pecten maximus]